MTRPQPVIDDLLRSHVATDRADIGESKTCCAIQAAAASLDDDLYRGAFGTVDLDTSAPTTVREDTPFDIASITKALVGATLAMQAVDEGRVHWDTPVVDILPAWSDNPHPDAHRLTFLQVLNHTSGLPDWRKFYLDHPLDPSPTQARKTRRAVVDAIIDTPLEAVPGTQHTYSDLGYILLARLLELLFDGEALRGLANKRIFRPLDLTHTAFVECPQLPSRIAGAAATEDCPLRERVVRGTVHDRNTNVIGGVSAHAGVFSTATDLLRFARHLLAIDRGRDVDAPLVSRKTLRFAWSPEAASADGHHLAGWDTPSGERSSAGRSFHRDHTVGHLGFTGTSLWIERQREVISILLTNRTYPSRENDRIKDLRIEFQESILPATGGDGRECR